MTCLPTQERTAPVEVTISCTGLLSLLRAILIQRYRAGVDATRSFATGCFRDHRTHDLRGLDEGEMAVRRLPSNDTVSARSDVPIFRVSINGRCFSRTVTSILMWGKSSIILSIQRALFRNTANQRNGSLKHLFRTLRIRPKRSCKLSR
jgi:hypothetical protein